MSRNGQNCEMKCMGAFESEGMEFTCEITCMFSCHDGYILYSFRHLNTSDASRRGG
jgi:hypothetical protein